MLHTVFNVMFTIFNTFIGNLMMEKKVMMYVITAIIWLINWSVIVYTSFLWEDMNFEGITAIIISTLYITILAPSFIFIANYINSEHQEEAALAFIEKQNYKQMFDAI